MDSVARRVVAGLAALAVVSTGAECLAGEGIIIYVRAGAPDGGSGLSWNSPFNSIDDAIQFSEGGGGGVSSIWVAEGVYRPSVERIKGDPRSRSFTSMFTLPTMIGGFQGFENVPPPAEIRRQHPTILSGDFAGNDVYGQPATFSENAYTVVHLENGGTLDGFVIEGGAATEPFLGEGEGGGVYFGQGGNFGTLRNCVIRRNIAVYGAGVHADFECGTLRALNCTFEENAALGYFDGKGTSGGHGGAVAAWVCGDVVLVNSTFRQNTARLSGGALFADGLRTTATNCTFVQNFSFLGQGGGAYIEDALGVIQNSILWENDAVDSSVELNQVTGSNIAMSSTCVQGMATFYGGNGNIGANPLLLPIGPGQDMDWNTMDDLLGDLIGAGSPCIDLGASGLDTDPTIGGTQSIGSFDVLGQARFVDGNGDETPTVDRGSRERQFTEDFLWIQADAGLWSQGFNWAGGQAPSALDIAIFDQTTGSVSLTVEGYESISGLRIDGSHTFFINQPEVGLSVGDFGAGIAPSTHVLGGQPRIWLADTAILELGNLFIDGALEIFNSTFSFPAPTAQVMDLDIGAPSQDRGSEVGAPIASLTLGLVNLDVDGSLGLGMSSGEFGAMSIDGGSTVNVTPLAMFGGVSVGGMGSGVMTLAGDPKSGSADLVLNGSGLAVRLAVFDSASGELHVGPYGDLFALGAQLRVGDQGTGVMTISAPAEVYADSVSVPETGSATGLLTIDGSSATLYTNELSIGDKDSFGFQSGPGEVQLFNDATIAPPIPGLDRGGFSTSVTVGPAGRLGGEGTIEGNVTNRGVVSVSPQGAQFVTSLNIFGDYVQEREPGASASTSGVLEILHGGVPGEPEYSELRVFGTVTLGGGLKVSVSDDDLIQPGGPTFRAVSAYERIGTFNVTVTPVTADRRFLRIVYQQPFGGKLGEGPQPIVLAVADFLDALIDVSDEQTFSLVQDGLPTAAAVRDLNNDGFVDLAITLPAEGEQDPGCVLFLFNAGTDVMGDWLGFQPTAICVTVGIDPVAIFAGNFNNDNLADLVVANRGSDTVTVLFNADGGKGPGDFTVVPPLTLPVGLAPMDVEAVDLSGNGFDDIVVANSGDNTVGVLLTNGMGGFMPGGVVPVGAEPVALTTGNFVSGGGTDIVTANRLGDSLTIISNDGPLALGAVGEIALPGGTCPDDVDGGDLDEDKDLDLIVAGQQEMADGSMSGAVGVIVADEDEDGGYATPVVITVGERAIRVRTADLDGVGGPEVVALSEDSATGEQMVNVLRNDTTNPDEVVFASPMTAATSAEPTYLETGDVDNDGDDDIVTLNDTTSPMAMLFGMPGDDPDVSVLLSDPIVYPAGDADGDGMVGMSDLNLVLANFNQAGLGLPGDFNNDDIVDFYDLNLVLGNFNHGM